MRGKDLYGDISLLDGELIERAALRRRKRGKKILISIVSAAACLCLILTSVLLLNRPKSDKNYTIINSYRINTGDNSNIYSCYAAPEPGKTVITSELQEAIEEHKDDEDVRYFISIDIDYGNAPGGKKQNITDAEKLADYERLHKLGYDLYETEVWTFRGKGEHYWIKVVMGLLTKEQILNFSTDEEYGYFLDFCESADGTPADLESERTVPLFD